MSNYDKKLNDFILHVMQEANRKKEQIEAELAAEKKRMLEEKEMEFLTAAYQLIQKEKNIAYKKANDKISKASMEHRRALFQKREQIISDVFNNVKKRIDEFLESPAYEDFLLGRVRKALELLGPGQITIYLDERDMRFSDVIKNTFSAYAPAVVASDTPIIGGCIVENKTAHRIVEDTIAERLETEKSRFVQESGLKFSE